jgi:hypothetical protein
MDCNKAYFFTEDLGAMDLALCLRTQSSVTIADPHLGYEEALNKEGILVPRSHLALVKERLEKIFNGIEVTSDQKLDTFIINGDLRHQFGPLSSQEWKESLSLLDFIKKKAKEVIIVKGNHDPNLGFLEDKVSNLSIVEKYKRNGCLFLHGDELPSDEVILDVEVIIIGHEHPVVSVRDNVTTRSEPYKCFLKGSFKGTYLIVQPSFNLLAKGSDLTREFPLSPFLKQIGLGDLEVFPVSDEGKIYSFGKLRELYSLASKGRKPRGVSKNIYGK